VKECDVTCLLDGGQLDFDLKNQYLKVLNLVSETSEDSLFTGWSPFVL